uniref:hypothetical protein n=1 Tax=Magnusiomyces suaveolens TaxID=44074 RepID=UPI001BEEEC95|nr:hypothetical protein LI407_mgp31 [Saprochaete suaveolens]QUV75111.1 hypothetical protein [Saprochaete suaveolens]
MLEDNTYKSYINKSHMDINFMQWFVGFTDAEGNFSIMNNKDYIRFRYIINLHMDDVEVTNIIKNNLEVGHVNTYSTHAAFVVYKYDELMYTLNMFDKTGLQTKKRFDYDKFRSVMTRKEFIGRKLNEDQKREMISMKNNMNKGMSNEVWDSATDVNMNQHWLIGFTEGDGTFGIKGLSPYYKVSQKYSEKTTFGIEKYMNSLLKTPVKTTHALNKRTNVVCLYVSDIDMLYYTMYPLFNNNMYSRKTIDFELWYMVLHCHKLGLHLTSEGREFMVFVSENNNKNRYSSVKDQNIWKENLSKMREMYKELLKMDPLTDMNKGLTHTQLTLEHVHKNHNEKTMYTYDNNETVLDSPFKTYAEVNEMLGTNKSGRTVYRKIDTNKTYKNRYLITSKPMIKDFN